MKTFYSFTGAGGDCHGSIDYICERVGAGRTAVKCALKNLTEKGYVTKTPDSKTKVNRYVANVQNRPLTGQKTTADRSESDPNNKDNNKDDNTTNNHSLIQGECHRPVRLIGDRKALDKTFIYEVNFTCRKANLTV